MLPPMPAMAAAAPATASGGTGRPSKMTWWGRPSGAASRPASAADSTWIRTPVASATSAASRSSAARNRPSSTGPPSAGSAPTTTPSTSCPWTTTCSMSTTSTGGSCPPGAARAVNSRAVTPRRSPPETVSSARGGETALGEVRVVRLERRPLGTDLRDLHEVVPRRRGRRRPLQRVPVTPGVVPERQPAVSPRLRHVVEERDRRGAEDEREDRRHRVQRGEPVAGQVVRVAPRHALTAEPVLHQERAVETDERQPEVQLAQPLVHHPAAQLREPEVDAGVGREHDGPEHHVVEVGDDEVAVVDVPVQRR